MQYREFIFFSLLMALGSLSAAAPIYAPQLEKDTQATYLGLTASCLTLIATAYQKNKSE